MAKDSIIAAIDVGTTKICTLVATIDDDGEPRVLGVGVVPSKGLRKGIVVNIDETTETIRVSVEKAQRSSGERVVGARVGISGGHITSLNNRGIVAVSRSDRLIYHEDVERVLEAARTISIPSNREVIHVIPRSYTLDGQEGVKNPVGMHGFRLDAETHIVTANVTSIQNLTKCVEALGIEVEDLILEPLASSEAVLGEEEKEMGVVLADIGGGTTDIAVFIDGSIWHTAVLPVGGYQLTNDIAIGLRTPFVNAEEIKISYGHAIPDFIDPDETVDIASFGSEGKQSIHRRQLSEIIKDRMVEILEMIHTEIKRSGYDTMLPAGLVVTGGSANLRGVETLAREILQMPVRVGVPRGVNGLVDTVSNPAYATSVGLLLWGLKHGEVERKPRKRRQGSGQAVKRFLSWIKELLPQ